jgi:hypothetical protein
MTNDLFGGLGGFGGALSGLVDGFARSGLVSTNTPEGKLLAAQTELGDLRKQESGLLLEIGQEAYERDPSSWPQDARLTLIRQNIATAQAALDEAKAEREQAEAEKAAEDAKGRCPECGYKNPGDVKFCQECGASLAVAGPRHCVACGVELAAGTRFCGACGARQDEQ